MKKISFLWSGSIFNGTIISQTQSGVLGQTTKIKTDSGMSFTFFGKCEIGNCGPFTVLSLDK